MIATSCRKCGSTTFADTVDGACHRCGHDPFSGADTRGWGKLCATWTVLPWHAVSLRSAQGFFIAAWCSLVLAALATWVNLDHSKTWPQGHTLLLFLASCLISAYVLMVSLAVYASVASAVLCVWSNVNRRTALRLAPPSGITSTRGSDTHSVGSLLAGGRSTQSRSCTDTSLVTPVRRYHGVSKYERVCGIFMTVIGATGIVFMAFVAVAGSGTSMLLLLAATGSAISYLLCGLGVGLMRGGWRSVLRRV